MVEEEDVERVLMLLEKHDLAKKTVEALQALLRQCGLSGEGDALAECTKNLRAIHEDELAKREACNPSEQLDPTEQEEIFGVYHEELQGALLGILDALCSALLLPTSLASRVGGACCECGAEALAAEAYLACGALDRMRGEDALPLYWVKGYTELSLKGEVLRAGHCTGTAAETALLCLKLLERATGREIATQDSSSWALRALAAESEKRGTRAEGLSVVGVLADAAVDQIKERANAKMKQGVPDGYETACFFYSLCLLLCAPSSPHIATLHGNRAEAALRLGRGRDAEIDALQALGLDGRNEKNERRLARARELLGK
eukprot:CAMPEP_0206225876 /NCGR_PEP_ID=MMETSP0047_2-20121206/7778_1 /ASSEMBLY_ACC=CAM_ASM_000192 /TAXON_ID=195065 /ORGANISM="Chroomonas mesostigmatica_cf, Strain CCMP1168" /LENGTH=317 /DNA_ID=CAMNT_0053648899 /DNA_START=30 /DNA_END=983 /DNA_ORIENTATION=-